MLTTVATAVTSGATLFTTIIPSVMDKSNNAGDATANSGSGSVGNARATAVFSTYIKPTVTAPSANSAALPTTQSIEYVFSCQGQYVAPAS
jgi:hypothetical protein